MNFQALNRRIKPPDIAASRDCRARWNTIAKPVGSLGLLEEAVIKIAALTGEVLPDISRRAVLVLCADNGVVAEGVTQTGSEVTALVAENIARGQACIRYMAARANVEVLAVDMGMNRPPDCQGILDFAVARGTQNLAKEPAMTAREAQRAICRGMALVRLARRRGYRLLATGEMGIGNTTTASAVTAVLLNQPIERVTGRGAGLNDAALRRKIRVIESAIQLHTPDRNDPFSVLQTLGGLDIAGMTGIFLGGALYRVPVLIDGFISAAAALLAARLCPAAAQAMLATHVSAEPAAALLLDALDLKPMITAGLHLGEGTGTVCAVPMLDMALAVYQNMATFEQIGITAYEPPKAPKSGVTA